MQKFVSQAKQNMADVAVLVADLDMPQNKGFELDVWYKKMGFKVVGRDWSGYPVMELPLNNKRRVTAFQKKALPSSNQISLQTAQDRGYFGPVYHGTTNDRRDIIDQEGFKVFDDTDLSGIQNGYIIKSRSYSDKHPGVPPPLHHLGFGVYFTTNKAIAKQFNYGGTGLKAYYLDVPKHETINFASPANMMNWWIKNGYDPELAKTGDRVAATKKLTESLKSKWDAVWFKGSGLHKLLDGDQICVYDPKRIYEVSSTLAQQGEAGAKVQRKSDGMKGVIVKRENIEHILERFPGASSWIKPGAKWRLYVKWQKGGLDNNVQDVDVDFLPPNI